MTTESSEGKLPFAADLLPKAFHKEWVQTVSQYREEKARKNLEQAERHVNYGLGLIKALEILDLIDSATDKPALRDYLINHRLPR